MDIILLQNLYIVSKIHIPLIENNTFILKVSYKSQVYVFQDKNTCAKSTLYSFKCIYVLNTTSSVFRSKMQRRNDRTRNKLKRRKQISHLCKSVFNIYKTQACFIKANEEIRRSVLYLVQRNYELFKPCSSGASYHLSMFTELTMN